LPVASLPQHDLVGHPALPAPQFPDLDDSQELTVGLDAQPEGGSLCGAESSGNCDVVHLLDVVAGVRHCICQIAVIGEDQQPFAVAVKATDRVQPLRQRLDQIDHRGPSLRILGRGDVSGGFVEGEVEFRFRLNRRAVDTDYLAARKNGAAKFGDGVAIDGNDAGKNQDFAGAPRTESALGEELVKANGIRQVAWSSGVRVHGHPLSTCLPFSTARHARSASRRYA